MRSLAPADADVACRPSIPMNRRTSSLACLSVIKSADAVGRSALFRGSRAISSSTALMICSLSSPSLLSVRNAPHASTASPAPATATVPAPAIFAHSGQRAHQRPPLPERNGRRLLARCHAELGEDLPDVVLRAGDRDAESLGDL